MIACRYCRGLFIGATCEHCGAPAQAPASIAGTPEHLRRLIKQIAPGLPMYMDDDGFDHARFEAHHAPLNHMPGAVNEVARSWEWIQCP